MSWAVETVTVVKSGPQTGEASVKIVISNGVSMSINKILIDLNDGSSPVTILQSGGTPICSGSLVDQLKELILELFQEGTRDGEPGLYVLRDGVFKKQ